MIGFLSGTPTASEIAAVDRLCKYVSSSPQLQPCSSSNQYINGQRFRDGLIFGARGYAGLSKEHHLLPAGQEPLINGKSMRTVASESVNSDSSNLDELCADYYALWQYFKMVCLQYNAGMGGFAIYKAAKHEISKAIDQVQSVGSVAAATIASIAKKVRVDPQSAAPTINDSAQKVLDTINTLRSVIAAAMAAGAYLKSIKKAKPPRKLPPHYGMKRCPGIRPPLWISKVDTCPPPPVHVRFPITPSQPIYQGPPSGPAVPEMQALADAQKQFVCPDGAVMGYDSRIFTPEQMMAKCAPTQFTMVAPIIKDATISYGGAPSGPSGGTIDYGAVQTAPQDPTRSYVPPGPSINPYTPMPGDGGVVSVPIFQGPPPPNYTQLYPLPQGQSNYYQNDLPQNLYRTSSGQVIPIGGHVSDPYGDSGSRMPVAVLPTQNTGGSLVDRSIGANQIVPGQDLIQLGSSFIDPSLHAMTQSDYLPGFGSGIHGLGLATPSVGASNKLLMLGLMAGLAYLVLRK